MSTEQDEHATLWARGEAVRAQLARMVYALDLTDGLNALARATETLESVVERGLRDALAKGTDEARLQAHLCLLDARDRLTALEPIIRGVVDATAKSIDATVEQGKLDLALARMTIGDALVAREKQARIDAGRASDAVKEALTDFEKRLAPLAAGIAKLM